MEKAILVSIGDPLDELRELAGAAGADVIGEVTQHRDRPDPALFIGKGKAEEIRDQVVEHEADLVIFDDELSPGQMRNLERILEVKVVDRTGLILDIFSRRARTSEGQLQVELAQLTYNLSRLAGGAVWLSRLGGGIGTRGPGETKLETDRRRIRTRISRLKSEIDQIRQHRRLHRGRRKRGHLPTVSLVGYTNAGKSTLFARLSGEKTFVSRRVFATLDPLVRRVRLGPDTSILLSDTVGFIRKLPHDLVDAFRATLEEVVEADLILHVIDASEPDVVERIRVVDDVLRDLGCEGRAELRVLNKIDQLESDAIPGGGVQISATTGEGIEELKIAIGSHLPAASHVG
jgi:GTP-binding protein HflX